MNKYVWTEYDTDVYVLELPSGRELVVNKHFDKWQGKWETSFLAIERVEGFESSQEAKRAIMTKVFNSMKQDLDVLGQFDNLIKG